MTAVKRSEMPNAYRPANGRDLEAFQNRWCAKCSHEDFKVEDYFPCKVMEKFIQRLNGFEDEFPEEWERDSQGAHCTAFQLSDTEIERFRNSLGERCQGWPSQDIRDTVSIYLRLKWQLAE